MEKTSEMRKRRNGKRKEVLKAAHAKGYRVSRYGKLIAPDKKPRAIMLINGGYPSFNFKYKGVSFHVFLHRLQAYQLFGDEIFKYGTVVRHKDHNKENAAANNLELGTDYDNHHDNPPEVKNRMYSNLKNYTPEELDGSEMPF